MLPQFLIVVMQLFLLKSYLHIYIHLYLEHFHEVRGEAGDTDDQIVIVLRMLLRQLPNLRLGGE